MGEFLTLEVKLPHFNGILEEIISFHAGDFLHLNLIITSLEWNLSLGKQFFPFHVWEFLALEVISYLTLVGNFPCTESNYIPKWWGIFQT